MTDSLEVTFTIDQTVKETNLEPSEPIKIEQQKKHTKCSKYDIRTLCMKKLLKISSYTVKWRGSFLL